MAITNPGITENCSAVLTWTLTGATTGSGTGFILPSQSFNIGKTRVHYTLTDASANTDTCSFQVWIKDLVQPKFTVTCVASAITQTADPDRCDANVAVPQPFSISNPCNEAFTVVNSYTASTANANGIYPVGPTTVTWTITDASGNVTTCPQTVTVTDDQDPVIACQSNIEEQVAANNCSKAGVAITNPGITENCSAVLT
ncbi:MAG: hypothetical protein FD166_3826, partial [Bacteroidetes bacterium]